MPRGPASFRERGPYGTKITTAEERSVGIRRAMIVSPLSRLVFWVLVFKNQETRQRRSEPPKGTTRLPSLLPTGPTPQPRGAARRKAEVCPQACALRAQWGVGP